ncbi:hypothetical protein LCGC14_2444630, partial [marine sediment metagenome]
EEVKKMQRQRATLLTEQRQSGEPWCDEGYGQAKNGNCPHHNGDACLKMPQGLVESLMCESDTNEIFEDATYRFMRHIQDQIEQEVGWIQFDYYRPEMDAHEYKRFVEAIGDPKDQARWNDLLERSHKQEKPIEPCIECGELFDDCNCDYFNIGSAEKYEKWKH